MRTDTVAVRDRILAVLFEHSLDPVDRHILSTREICDRAGPYHELRTDPDEIADCQGLWLSCHYREPGSPRIVQCDGRSHVWEFPLSYSQRGLQSLHALQRQGKVTKFKVPADRAVFWTLTPEHRDVMLHAAAQLEAMWVMSDG